MMGREKAESTRVRVASRDFLERSGEYLASLSRLSSVAILHADADGRARFLSARWESISGQPAGAGLGHGWVAVLHPDDRARVLDHWRRHASTGTEFVDEYRVSRPNGQLRIVHLQVAPVADGREPPSFVGTVEDITDRLAAEQALRRLVVAEDTAHRRIQALFDYSLDAIVLVDDDGRYVQVNGAACAMLGYAREELLAKTLADVSARTEGLSAAWHAFLAQGELSGDYVLRRKDGALRTVDFRAVAHVLPGTHMAILRDVTDRNAAQRARRHYVKRLEILAAIDRAILAARSPASIADAVVSQVAQLLPTTRVSVTIFDEEGGVGTILAVWSLRPTRLSADARYPMAEGRSVSVRSGTPAIVGDLAAIADRTAAENSLLAEGIRSYLRIPLRTQDAVIGSLNVAADEPHGFTAEHLAIAGEVGDSLAVAIRNAQLVEQLQNSTSSLAAMSKRLLELQERERRDIARELHDEIGQVLTGLKLQLDVIRQRAPEPLAADVKRAELLADDLMATVRRLARDLRPPLLDELGLERALAGHFERFTKQTGVQVKASVVGLAEMRLPLEVETAAFRLVQESLTNVARHAAVGSAFVELVGGPRALEINVFDHGHGFDALLTERWGTGLAGMKERVTLLGGIFRVDSMPAGGGTTIHAVLPFDRDGGLL